MDIITLVIFIGISMLTVKYFKAGIYIPILATIGAYMAISILTGGLVSGSATYVQPNSQDAFILFNLIYMAILGSVIQYVSR